jgi:DNA-3-methyladenine glycosylase
VGYHPSMDEFILADDDLLPASFFAHAAEKVAPRLLGKLLVSSAGGVPTGGRIVETEAYLGSGDPGSHASTKGITSRNRVMYGPAGSIYVYFTYGNHHMVNLVCQPEGVAAAVLVRALEPLLGIDEMARRRGRSLRELCNGPGKLAEALGVDLRDNGTMLGEGRLVVYDAPRVPDERVGVSGRIGLSAGHDLDLRFFVKDSRFVSRGRTGPLSRRVPETGGRPQ